MTTPTTTKGVRIFEHGDEDVLQYGDYPLERPGLRSVTVRVAAASVSRWDLMYRVGLPPELQHPGRKMYPLPQQLGREAAGEVIDVGADVTAFEVGDRVVGVVHPEDAMSVEAARGLANLSPNVELPGHTGLGAYAEYLMRDESMWFKLDDSVDIEQAAVTLWPFATAHRIVRDRMDVHLGDVVLVLGASGGMGAATVQLASMMGAVVVATSRSAAKAEGIRQLGASEVVVVEDLDEAARRLRRITRGAGVEHVVDYVGDNSLTRFAVRNMRLGGKYCVSTGELGGAPVPVSASDFIRLELSVLGVRGGRRNDALVALDLLTRGAISTPIAARFPLAEARQAHRFLEENRNAVGRVVLVP